MTRNDAGQALFDCLTEISALLDSARRIAANETDALVRNDAEALTLSCKAQEEILRRICEADRRASAVTEQLAEMADVDFDNADSDAIARAAGYPYSELIINETKRISLLAEAVQEANIVNRQLLQNGLEIIACCIRSLATEPAVSLYSRSAGMQESRPYILSVDRKA
jgi:hypothetical protein